MKRLQGYQFQLNPKHKHLEHLRQSLGANRFVWNKFLAMNLLRLRQKQPLLWYHEMAWFITLWKKSDEYAFLKEAPSQSLQQTAKNLDKAFRDAFDKNQSVKRLPIFKKRGKNEAGIRYPQGFTLDEPNAVLKLPKLGWLKYRKSQRVKGTIKNVTLTRSLNTFRLSIQTEREVPTPVHPASTAVGIDMGIVNFATLSTGESIAPKNAFQQFAEKLAVAQQRLKHKRRLSANWQKQKSRIAQIHRKIAHVRQNFLHQVSHQISKNHAMIVMEDLKVQNMSRSATGTVDNPGKQVAQKRGLNRSILDQGWGEFRRQLAYKQAWRGGHLWLVNPRQTSQTCPDCGHVEKGNRLSQAIFRCLSCGYENGADFVAAQNILFRGLKAQA